jgi:hypothetical protein
LKIAVAIVIFLLRVSKKEMIYHDIIAKMVK